MNERKWRKISVDFDNGDFVQINRSDFDEMEKIAPVLEALEHVKRMQHDVNRLLGEAEGCE